MLKLFKTLNGTALLKASVAVLIVVAVVLIGSRDLQNFDPALVSYLLGTIFAVFGIAYRYSVWLQRPPTRLYWHRSMSFLFSKDFIPYFFRSVKLFFRNILFQRFIAYRSRTRWAGHFLLASGCLLAFAITIPLTFGWIHFELKPGDDVTYYAKVFGFEAGTFALGSVQAFVAFHGLVWCSIFVIIGAVMMMKRRMTNGGMIATQSFTDDLLPLILLIAISVTGLGISYDYTFLQGKTYQFMAVTHAVVVILWLVWLPFGKFFHIFQRLGQLGANLYREEGKRRGMATCAHTKEQFATQMHIDDLKVLTERLGFDFNKSDGTNHLDLSPEGKRSALAKAHLKARQESGKFFG